MKDMTLNRYRVIFDKFKILSHLLLNYLNLRNRGDSNPDLTPKIHRKRCVPIYTSVPFHRGPRG